MSQNLSFAAVVIGALRVKNLMMIYFNNVTLDRFDRLTWQPHVQTASLGPSNVNA